MKMTRILALVLAAMLLLSSVAVAETKYVCETDGQTYPITDGLTLSFWYPQASSLGTMEDYNDGEFWKWFEKKTGVHIDFIVPTAGSERDSFHNLFLDDELPDLIYSQPASYTYADGEDNAITDEWFVDISEYLDYAPNYKAWLEEYPVLKKGAYTDGGRMYGFWGFWLPIDEELGVMADQGISIRKDLLDKVGMDVPVTYDDWYNVLKAFKEQLGIEAPLYTSKYGIDPTGEFMAGYGTAPYFYQKDGVVKYGPLDEEYKAYLTMLNKWWNEGLLDRDFSTRSSTGITADNDMMLNDKVGALIDYGTRLSDTYVTRGHVNPDVYFVGTSQPVLQVGDQPAYRDYAAGNNYMQNVCINISTSCKDIVAAVKWIDAFYAKDIYLNANYGLEEREGTVWYKAEDGHRIGDYDFRYKNPEGMSSATVLVYYWTKNPPIRVEACQIEQSDANKQAGWKIWSEFEPSAWIPTRVTMTADESSEYSSLYADIETYVQECNVKFIMGQMSLDDYDAYCDTLRKMGIEKCIELKQAAMDRYIARGE